MTVLQPNGVLTSASAGNGSGTPTPRRQTDSTNGTSTDPGDTSGLVNLHESIANLLASRGQWRQAYYHLRSALDLISLDEQTAPPPPAMPDQLRHEVDRLRKAHEEAREQSLRDSLTASYNRRYLDQRLVVLIAEQGDEQLAVAFVDLDCFKQVNDTHGHLLGDRVLQRVVELLQQRLPEGAFCARYGGEEFVLVLPGIAAETAVAVCEAARARVEDHQWSQLAEGLQVTISVGVSHEPARSDGRPPSGPQKVLLRADGLLYVAKQSGRNAVAYRNNGRVRLAGQASGRRSVMQHALHSGDESTNPD